MFSSIVLPILFDPRLFLHQHIKTNLSASQELDLLLIHDPRLRYDTAKIGIGIYTGSANDPYDLPGLAHYFEHTVYLGSEKYPSTNESSSFDLYLERVGGTTNAATFPSHTIFAVTVPRQELTEAISRLVDMLTNPSFNRKAVWREATAIDAEHQKNLNDKNHILFQCAMNILEPPLNKFGTGSFKTLISDPNAIGVDTLDYVKSYHQAFVDTCNAAIVVATDDTIVHVEDELFRLLRTSLKGCKHGEPNSGWSELYEICNNNVYCVCEKIISDSAMVIVNLELDYSGFHVIIPMPIDRKDHPEIVTSLQELVTSPQSGILNDLKQRLQIDFDPSIRLEALDINPIRLLIFTVVLPAQLSGTTIEYYATMTEIHDCLMQFFIMQGSLLTTDMLDTIHTLIQSRRLFKATPKLSTPGDIIDFVKKFMNISEFNGESRNYLSFLDGYSDKAISLREFKLVLSNITHSNHLIAGSAGLRLFREFEKDESFILHYNEPYQTEFLVKKGPLETLEIDRVSHNYHSIPECLPPETSSGFNEPQELFEELFGISIWQVGGYTTGIPLTRIRVDFSLPVECSNDFAAGLTFHVNNHLRKQFALEHACGVDIGARNILRNTMTVEYTSPKNAKLMNKFVKEIGHAFSSWNSSTFHIVKYLEDMESTGFDMLEDKILSYVFPLHVSRFDQEDFNVLVNNPRNDLVSLKKGAVMMLGIGYEKYQISKLPWLSKGFSGIETLKWQMKVPEADVFLEVEQKQRAELVTPSISSSNFFDIRCTFKLYESGPQIHESLMLVAIIIPHMYFQSTVFVQTLDELSQYYMNQVFLKCISNALSLHLFDELRNRKHIGYVIDAQLWIGDKNHSIIRLRSQYSRKTKIEMIRVINQSLKSFKVGCSHEQLNVALTDVLGDLSDPDVEFRTLFNALRLGYKPSLKFRRKLEKAIAQHADSDEVTDRFTSYIKKARKVVALTKERFDSEGLRDDL